jgi:hypothetical protein
MPDRLGTFRDGLVAPSDQLGPHDAYLIRGFDTDADLVSAHTYNAHNDVSTDDKLFADFPA